MKNLYHSFNKWEGFFYEQWDLFEVKDLKKTKKESWTEFSKTWVQNYRTPAQSTPTVYSKTYDTVKDFMTRIKLLDSDAKFYWYCSASWWNDSNNVWWKIYALYNREVIPEQTEEWTWRVVREALIEPTLYKLEDFPYDQWKFMTLALFDEILWSCCIHDTEERNVTIELCNQCTAEKFNEKKKEVTTQRQKRAEEIARNQPIGNE